MAPNTLDFTKLHTVTLVAGQAKKIFEVSSNIVLRSAVLGNRLKKYEDDKSITMWLPEYSSENMELYLDFIHRGPHDLGFKDNEEPAVNQKNIDLANIYIMSQKLEDMGAKNDVVTAMLKVSKIKDKAGKTRPPCPAAVRILYGQTSPTSPIRRLLVDLWIPIDPDWVIGCTGNHSLPVQFLIDVIIATGTCMNKEQNGLLKLLVAVMKCPEVQGLRNQASIKQPEAYMES